MKKCLKCGQVYTESEINFCLNDGELLAYLPDGGRGTAVNQSPTGYADDSPPTLMMDPTRVTSAGQPPATWGNSIPQNVPNQVFGNSNFNKSRDQTLPTISLSLAIASFVLICCYGGIWLGVPAAVIGFLGMRNADTNPNRYSGRGLAIAGLVLGIVTFLASLVFAFISILAD